MLKWEDRTSYSRGATKRKPRILITEIEDIAFTVHRHTDYPETWLLTCNEMLINKIDLETDDLEEAKVKAVNLLQHRAKEQAEKFIRFSKALDKV